MDRSEGRRVFPFKYNVMLVNGAVLKTGHTDNAVYLNGRDQYVDLDKHMDRCLGNIDLCLHGQTVSLWINPEELKNGDYFLATPTYTLFYGDGNINAEYRGKTKTWYASSSRLKENTWQRITLAWHPTKGLTLFINDELMSQDRRGENIPRDRPYSEHIYVGRNLVSPRSSAKFLMDDIQVWYDDLDQLLATGQYRSKYLASFIY